MTADCLQNPYNELLKNGLRDPLRDMKCIDRDLDVIHLNFCVCSTSVQVVLEPKKSVAGPLVYLMYVYLWYLHLVLLLLLQQSDHQTSKNI